MKNIDCVNSVEDTAIYKFAYKTGLENPYNKQEVPVPIILYGAPYYWSRQMKVAVWIEAYKQGQLAARVYSKV